jgi:hypothetical protein
MKYFIANQSKRLMGLFHRPSKPNPNRANELEEAKKMFLYYGCNHFYMMKEGESEKYEKYHVSKKQEQIWHDEYMAYWLEKLSVDDLSALWHLRNSWTQDVIPTLIEMADKGDSFAKFWFADTILWISNGMVRNKQGRQAAIALLKSIVKGPVIISEQHRTEVDPSMMHALDASSPEEYLINYSKRKLTELKVKLSTL